MVQCKWHPINLSRDCDGSFDLFFSIGSCFLCGGIYGISRNDCFVLCFYSPSESVFVVKDCLGDVNFFFLLDYVDWLLLPGCSISDDLYPCICISRMLPVDDSL